MKALNKIIVFVVRCTVATFAVLFLPSTACASRITLDFFSPSPSAIYAGESSTWTLGITVQSPRFYNLGQTANLTFVSGDGQSTVFSGSIVPQTVNNYGWVDNWVNQYVGDDCNGHFLGDGGPASIPFCVPVYNYVNVPLWGVISQTVYPQRPNASFTYSGAGAYFGSVTGTVDAIWGDVGGALHEDQFNIYETGQGKITTTWQEWEPVYGWVDNWINPIVDYDCSYFDGRGPECLPVYGDLTNVPVWSVTGGEYITQAQTLSFSPLIVLDRPSSVPEPATIALVVIALAGLFLSQRKIVI